MPFVRIFVLLLVLLPAAPLAAQGTLADYRRAEAADTLFKNKVFNSPSSFHWLKDNIHCWYKNNSRGGKEFIVVNAETETQAPAFDHARLAGALAQCLNRTVDPEALPFDHITLTGELRDSVAFQVDSARLRCHLSTYACAVTEVVEDRKRDRRYWGDSFDERGNRPVPSPDSLWTACIKNHNVYIRHRKTESEFQLSYDGAAGDFYSSYMQWAPDSKKLMACKVRPGEKHLIYFVESSPEDQLQPKLCSREYLKPGDALPHKRPQLFLVDEKKHVPVSDELFRNQFSLSTIKWRDDSRAFTFEYNERGHQRYRVVEVSAPSGSVRALVDESSDTFIDYSSKKYRYDVAGGKEIVWASERDGWNHLYLYDGQSGKVKNRITKGEWVVRNVIHVDEEARQIIFSAGGLDRGQDPYYMQYCRINFDGSGFKRLTTAHANHSATFSEDHRYFVDHYSRTDMPPVAVLCRASDGKEIMPLRQADITGLQAGGWKTPEVFTAKGRDGKTDIWGIIIRPSNFDPQKKYPVIEYIYAGPHGFFVPKSFHATFRGIGALAELGFIVVQMDGMGTSGRSRAFHDVCWKNLKDAGFPDRIAWIKAAAKKYPYMDISRVGIFGTSAGGQSATGGLLFYPDFYKVGVSSCGCHDNRMDKIWWNEQWMGYPVGPQYAASSNVENACRLRGRLMLILGEVDDNVDPASTMQLADALIKANRDFELVVIPGMGHSSGGEYGERKRRDFFVKHLLGVEPPAWKQVYEDEEVGL